MCSESKRKDKYLGTCRAIHQQREVFCDKSVTVGQTKSITKSWVWLESLFGKLSLFENRCILTDSSSCLHSWIFFWKDNHNHSNGIATNLGCMTNSKWIIFSHVKGHNKKENQNLRFATEDLIVYLRINNMTVWTWHDRSTWQVSKVFGQSSLHSGWTLSIDRLLFWALRKF